MKRLGRERRSRREIRVLSARLLWTTSFPCKQRKCKWSKYSKRLFTVFPKRSVALCLCSSRAAPSSFSLFFTSELFSSANFSRQLYLRELGLVRSSSGIFLLAYFGFILGNQQGHSVSYESFTDFEFRMIKATQVYSYLVTYTSSLSLLLYGCW